MRRRIRWTRAWKWAGAVLLLVLVVVWALSGWRQVARVDLGTGYLFCIEHGQASLSYWWHDPAAGFRLGPMRSAADLAKIVDEVQRPWWRQWSRWGWSMPRAWCRRKPGDTSIGVELPLWLVCSGVGAPTALLWYRDRRRPPGVCPTCGYDLEGNRTGICPECGQASGMACG